MAHQSALARRLSLEEMTQYFVWMDELRASKRVPIFSCVPVIIEELGLSSLDAKSLFSAWMNTWTTAKTARVRAEIAKGIGGRVLTPRTKMVDASTIRRRSA